MKLDQVTREIGECHVEGDTGQQVTGITHDSRRVRPGDLYVAVRGERTDGNRFVADAVSRGAVAILSRSPRPDDAGAAAWIRVADERAAMARAAGAVLGHPDRRMALVGVTGTNGKTTTAYLLESILTAAGRRPGVSGTVEYRWPGHAEPAARTTPEATDLQRMLLAMADAGCGEAILEISSHALALHRVAGLEFRVAVFTNLTQDHLDFHGDLDAYLDAKAILFEGLAPEATAVLNADDPRYQDLRRRTAAQVLTYGSAPGADVRLLDSTSTFDGSRGRMQLAGSELTVELPLPGIHNLWNAMAAVAAAHALGIGADAMCRGLASLAGVPGRFERVRCGQPFEVVVDFAHTDDALRGLLEAVRSLHPARVITVFGCGGDRDRGKRPRMGAAAARGSDVVILTSDNPRGEDPDAVADEAEAGVLEALARPFVSVAPAENIRDRDGREYHRRVDRREAIELALSLARQGDAVVIAGKGHENTQVIGGRSFDFDDREVCRELLGKRFGDDSRG